MRRRNSNPLADFSDIWSDLKSKGWTKHRGSGLSTWVFSSPHQPDVQLTEAEVREQVEAHGQGTGIKKRKTISFSPQAKPK